MQNDLFHRDALTVGEAARANEEVFLRVIMMVLLSIRQPWTKVPDQFHGTVTMGTQSPYLFGFKRAGYQFAHENISKLHRRIVSYEHDKDLVSLIYDLMAVPGLGLAKASFVAQLTVNDGACLDGHNLRRLGLDPNFTRLDKNLQRDRIEARINAYNASWATQGDSAYWWNTWCVELATKYKVTPEEISALHRLPLL